MTRPTLYNWASASVDEKIQVFFAKNIAKLVEIIMKGESEPGVLSVILYDSLDFFYSSWGWISSRQSARILWDALSQYQEPGNIQIPAEYEELFKDQGARKREELLEHCWKLFVKSGGRKLR
ncbi:hypothetical protein K435DRAFT_781391 [Dendrothele bispora CBS 962.96]|uniref:Uncharacterized protein n=1 Tax=Dendrothele bispora (strain CBS 962.96) TaxID=1314807 RepID=A0A4S8LLA5_DENBC|nr:hypothetical protein K435DRAFT_781391 [Dendrothele bispora CBS 962.96]